MISRSQPVQRLLLFWTGMIKLKHFLFGLLTLLCQAIQPCTVWQFRQHSLFLIHLFPPFPFIHVLKVYLNRRLFSFLFLRNFSILLLFSFCCSDFRNQQFLKQFFLPVGVLFFRQVRNPAHDRLFLREYIASLTPFPRIV